MCLFVTLAIVWKLPSLKKPAYLFKETSCQDFSSAIAQNIIFLDYIFQPVWIFLGLFSSFDSFSNQRTQRCFYWTKRLFSWYLDLCFSYTVVDSWCLNWSHVFKVKKWVMECALIKPVYVKFICGIILIQLHGLYLSTEVNMSS